MGDVGGKLYSEFYQNLVINIGYLKEKSNYRWMQQGAALIFLYDGVCYFGVHVGGFSLMMLQRIFDSASQQQEHILPNKNKTKKKKSDALLWLQTAVKYRSLSKKQKGDMGLTDVLSTKGICSSFKRPQEVSSGMLALQKQLFFRQLGAANWKSQLACMNILGFTYLTSFRFL